MLASLICEENERDTMKTRPSRSLNTEADCNTDLKLLLWVPYDQVGIIAGGQGALPVVKTTQPGCLLAEESRHVRQLEASLTG